MKKNTKILLGLGAVIAAYLILKPKKVLTQTSVVNTPNTKVCPKGQELKLVDVNCAVAPCPPISMCVPIRKTYSIPYSK